MFGLRPHWIPTIVCKWSCAIVQVFGVPPVQGFGVVLHLTRFSCCAAVQGFGVVIVSMVLVFLSTYTNIQFAVLLL